MKSTVVILSICYSFFFSIAAAGVVQPPEGHNYIKTRTYSAPSGHTYYDDINYFDGLGKLRQVSNKNATPASKDMVTMTEYDGLGWQHKVWLPTPVAANGNYVAPAILQSVAQGSGGYNDHIPYTTYFYENTPFQRLLGESGPGQAFQVEAAITRRGYFLNDLSDSLSCWQLELDNALVSTSAVRCAGIAAANTISVSRISGPDNMVSYEFINTRGQLILKRQKVDHASYADTYYVYDQKGNLCYVLPPMLSVDIALGVLLQPSSVQMDVYAFMFDYDHRNRCIGKKLPGRDWEYMVYDKADRLVLSQDGNLRARAHFNDGNTTPSTLENSLWQHTVYDNFNRITKVEIVSLGAGYTRDYLQANYSSVVTQTEFISPEKILCEYYFDDYRIGENGPATLDVAVSTSMYLKVTARGEHLDIFPSADFAYINNKHINRAFYICSDPHNAEIEYFYIPLICEPYIPMLLTGDLTGTSDAVYYFPESGSPLSVVSIPDSTNEDRSSFSDYLTFQPVADVVSMADVTTQTKGYSTIDKIAVLNSIQDDNYIERAYYYDYKGRVIQIVEKNHLGGVSRISFKYDFVGNVLAKCELHQSNPQDQSIDTLMLNYSYDHRGRLLSDSASLNGGTPAVTHYQYNDLGQLIGKSSQDGLLNTSLTYNIRGWETGQEVTKGTDRIFSSQLRYYDPQQPATIPSYAGNISEWTWQNGAGTEQNTYAFTYDKLMHLADTKQYVNGARNDRFVEKNLKYDFNGNISTLTRINGNNPDDVFKYVYIGNQLITLVDSLKNWSCDYEYDRNGNMIVDESYDLNLIYNHLNLIEKVRNNGVVQANYSYLADGTKLSGLNSEDCGLVYLGSLVYLKLYSEYFLKNARFSGGRLYTNLKDDSVPVYHITDHLGSVRIVVGSDGYIEEYNDYYPFGLRWETPGRPIWDVNLYRYNGKENQGFLNVPYTDYGARMYDPKYRLGWNGVDPMLELDHAATPYGYCSNNPIKFMDIGGLTKFLAITMGKDVRYRGDIIAINNSSVEHHSISGGIGGLVSTLKNASSQDPDGIGFMAIWSHGTSNKIMEEDGAGAITVNDLDNLKNAVDNGEIAFAKGSIIYLGGCNVGWTDKNGKGFAQRLADITGAVVVAANDKVTPIKETNGDMIYSTGHPIYPNSYFWRFGRKKRYKPAEGKQVNVMSLLYEAIEWTGQRQRFDLAPINPDVRRFVRGILDVNPNVRVFIK